MNIRTLQKRILDEGFYLVQCPKMSEDDYYRIELDDGSELILRDGQLEVVGADLKNLKYLFSDQRIIDKQSHTTPDDWVVVDESGLRMHRIDVESILKATERAEWSEPMTAEQMMAAVAAKFG